MNNFDMPSVDNLTPEEREAWASDLKEKVIKEGQMLEQGGQYEVNDTGAVSYQFSENQLGEREKAARENRISKFYEFPDRPFSLDAEINTVEKGVLAEMIRQSREFVEDVKEQDGQWIVVPTKHAVREAFLRAPRREVPAEQMLDSNERSEYPELIIDNSLTLEQAITAAGLDTVNKSIESFPFETGSEAMVTPELVRLGRWIDWKEAEEEIDKMGLRSVTLREFLAFAGAHPDDPNWRNPVIAIGLKAVIHMETRTPYIHRRSKDESGVPMKRELDLTMTVGWQPGYVALCVKKSIST